MFSNKEIFFLTILFAMGVFSFVIGLYTFFNPKCRLTNSDSFMNKPRWGTKKPYISNDHILKGFISGMTEAEMSVYYIISGIIFLFFSVLSFSNHEIISSSQIMKIVWIFGIMPIAFFSSYPHRVFKKLALKQDDVFDIDKIISQFNQPTSFDLNLSVKKDWNLNKIFLAGYILIGLTIIYNLKDIFSLTSLLAMVLLCSGVICLFLTGFIPITYPFIKNLPIWKKQIKRLKVYISLYTAFFSLGAILMIHYLQFKWL